jgi:phage head maturation protease
MTQTLAGPRGWHAGKVLHRFSSAGPSSYDAESHSVECVISVGAPVKRIYGVEVLEISRSAIDLSRLPIPVLDSHSQASIDNVLGTISEAWISGGQLMGKIVFARTAQGRKAEGMISRNEISGISAGYQILKWSAVDADGDSVDPESARWDSDLVFTAIRWALLECSVVSVPADAMAGVRSFDAGGHDEIATIRSRMMTRERMSRLQRMHDKQQIALGRDD